jgi:hypothetical protein
LLLHPQNISSSTINFLNPDFPVTKADLKELLYKYFKIFNGTSVLQQFPFSLPVALSDLYRITIEPELLIISIPKKDIR